VRAVSRDRKLVEERRRQIADGGMSVFIRHGFEKATTRQIAEASNMTSGNLYNYVKSKEDILYLAMDRAIGASYVDLAQVSSNPQVALTEAIKTAYSQINKEQNFVLFVYQESKNLPLPYRKRILDSDRDYAASFQEILTKGVEKGVFESGLDPFLVSQSIVVLGHLWCFRRWLLRDKITFDQYLERQLHFILSAIGHQSVSIPRAARREKRLAELRRKQIAHGAVRVFIDQGFEKATIRQIAESSDMSVGSIYNYVNSKEDVLFLAMDYAMRVGMADIGRHSSDPRTALRDAIRRAYTNMNKEQDFVLFVYQEAKRLPPEYRQRILDSDREYAERFQEIVAEGIEKGAFKSDVDPFLVSQNIVVLGHMWCFRRWLLKDKMTFDQYLQRQLRFIFDAIDSDIVRRRRSTTGKKRAAAVGAS
jgi:AcrR family transcriptional regulator